MDLTRPKIKALDCSKLTIKGKKIAFLNQPKVISSQHAIGGFTISGYKNLTRGLTSDDCALNILKGEGDQLAGKFFLLRTPFLLPHSYHLH